MIKNRVALIILLLLPSIALAQYYDWGQDPASTRWRSIETPGVRYIFPMDNQRQAVRLMNYMDTVRQHISFGFRHGVMERMPLVMHTQNFQSNGIVMLAPRRMELITTPPGGGQFAFPWLKQLAVHEYRHAVQYNNLNRGMIRPLRWLLGQQGGMIGLAFMPVWAMEGDAVMAETQMSGFGRGLQPSFSMEYRAMLLEGSRPKRRDTWFSGSYKRHMPDHYQLGYQIISWSWGRYGENILDRTSQFASRNVWMICPFTIALKKFYDTTTGRMFTEAFADLERHWRSLPLEDNSAQIIETPRTSYTTYSSPHAVGEHILAFKADLDRTSRLVRVYPQGDARAREEVLCRTGAVNSPLTVLGRRVYWTEMRQSTLWEQRVGSVLCSYDLDTGRKRVHNGHRNILFPIAAGDTLAWVEYHRGGFYSIGRHTLPDTVSIHGLASMGGTLYFIGLDEGGMWIGAADNEGTRRVTRPSRVTISSLAADKGMLYFGSIASGKDEVHKLDPATGREQRVTTSRYGSFEGTPTGDRMVALTYTPDGYLLSQTTTAPVEEVSYSELPRNILNPPHTAWEVPDLDHITVDAVTTRPVKKYRRGRHLFNFHSWAPVWFTPEQVTDQTQTDIMAGVTLMSQNNLNSAYTELKYGHTGQYGVASAKFRYMGWAPKVEFEVQWSDLPQIFYGAPPQGVKLKDDLQFTAFAYLPLILSSGATVRILSPTVQWDHINALFFEPGKKVDNNGMNRLVMGVRYSGRWRMAHRDFAPRWGYDLRLNRSLDPLNSNIGRLWSASGGVWIPGIGAHHSLHLQGAWQEQKTKKYLILQKSLFPRGVDYNHLRPEYYRAATVDYALPLAYPDWGINSLLYVRRVRLAAGFDHAQYKEYGKPWQQVWSYGGELTLDMSPLRLPAAVNSTLTISIRKPSDRNALWAGVGMSMQI